LAKKRTDGGTTRRSERPRLEVNARGLSGKAKARPRQGAPKAKGARPAEPKPKAARPTRAPEVGAIERTAARRAERPRKAQKPGKDRNERARQVAIAIARAGLDTKASHVEVIDVRGKVDYADYVVVMSGRSDRQVGALARNVQEHLETKEKVRCLGIEGMPQGSWVLMDYGDVIVHVFHEDTRGYYDLEALWIDAARVRVDDAPQG
jgi:ribosome-associated protein